MGAKLNAGFDVSITDFWGRALSYQLLTPIIAILAFLRSKDEYVSLRMVAAAIVG